MELHGERLIEASREKVRTALNDPATLQACIPGCETIERVSDTELRVVARLALGGDATRYTAKLLISGFEAADGYTISAEGQDGSSSFSSRARLILAEAASGTQLSVSASGQPNGSFAAEPSKDTQTAMRDYLESFLSHFATMVAPGSTGAPDRETQLKAQGKAPESVLPVLEQVPPVAVPEDPAAHVAHAEPFHPPAHEDHDHDPSNPHYFGLPLGVILAGAVAGVSVCITVIKFLG